MDTKIESHILIKNTIINFIGQTIPIIIAVVTIPYIIRGLGTERFGMLSLVWMILGYFNIFDFGLTRATTNLVSKALAENNTDDIPKIIWTSLIIQIILSFFGGFLLAVSTPFLVDKILKIPLSLIEETKITLYLLSGAIPIVACSRNLRGIFEGGQHFDLINAVQIPSSSLVFLFPLLGVYIGINFNTIVLSLIVLWSANVLLYMSMLFRIFPDLKCKFYIDRKIFCFLITFGGWVTISNILVPILIYIDRFLISAIVSITALTYYTVPYEIVSKISIFPGILSLTLFPVFSRMSDINKKDIERIYARSLKYIITILGPIVVLLILFSKDILFLWLGKDFVEKSTIVFQILAIGMLLNALAQMPANLIDGIGRPDVKAKIFISYVFIYSCAAWFLIAKFGILGAAFAWASRGCLEFCLFFIASWNLLRFKPNIFIESGLFKGLAVSASFAALAFSVTNYFYNTIWVHSILTIAYLIIFGLLIWYFALDKIDRNGLKVLFPAKVFK